MNSTFQSNLEAILAITMMIVGAAYLFVCDSKKERNKHKEKKYRIFFSILIFVIIIIKILIQK